MSRKINAASILLTDLSPGADPDLAVRNIFLLEKNNFTIAVGRSSTQSSIPSRFPALDNAYFNQRGVSRNHGYISYEDGVIWYRDNNSRNGTKVDKLGLVSTKVKILSEEGEKVKITLAPNLTPAQSLSFEVKLLRIGDLSSETSSSPSPKVLERVQSSDSLSNRKRKRESEEDSDEPSNPDSDDKKLLKPRRKTKDIRPLPKRQRRTETAGEVWSFTAGVFAGALGTVAALIAIGASNAA